MSNAKKRNVWWTNTGYRKGNKIKVFKTRIQVDVGRGRFFIADVEDLDKIKKYTWRFGGAAETEKTKPNKYITTSYWDGFKTNELRLHRYLLGIKKGEHRSTFIDHIDRNPLNNRKANLRAASPYQSSLNRAAFKTSRSGVPCVHRRKDTGKYRVVITALGRRISLGQFDTLEEAEARAIAAKNLYHGEYSPYFKKEK